MKHLFSPFSIRHLELKNRIAMPALASFLIHDDGSVMDEAIEHYRLRAAGGPAMIIMEACGISPEGVVSRHQARIDDDRYLEGLTRIAGAITQEGAIPAVQLHHAGRQTSGRVIGCDPLAPSDLPCPTIRGDVSPLTKEGIQRLVTLFGDAAARAQKSGFELIEIHGAHGYLVNQFLSPFSNIRDDAYGRDTRGRARFAVEIVEEVRRRLGDDFPISFKISAQEFVPGGLDVEESIRLLKILVDAGIDVVQVSAGNDASHEWICQPMFMQKACLADSAAQIRQALDIPVMAVGRINSPTIADEIIERGMADLVYISRGLLADFELPQKAMEGRLDEIRPCIGCNTCMESIFRKGRIECLVNPTLGREKEMEIRPADRPRKVMVIGGGPGGLNSAWIAAKRGHDVHLFEKQDFLGGQLLTGSTPWFKQDLMDLVRFQKYQVDKSSVVQHLGCEVTLADIREFNPDIIIMATGSLPIIPQVEGIDNPIVVTYATILDGTPLPEGPVVIIGGGATGCEIALHLAESGTQVTLVEMMPKIGRGIEVVTKKLLIKKLKEYKVDVLTETRLVNVVERGAVVAGPDDKATLLEAVRVVLAVGTRSASRLYEEVTAEGFEVHRIGDCLEPRNAKAAIHESAVLARSI